MTRLFSLALVLIALATALPVPAWAGIDAAGATELKALLEKGLATQKARWEKGKTGEFTLETEGEFVVTPKENYYAVVSPRFGLKVNIEKATIKQVTLGTVSMNVMPAANNEWKVTAALPTPIHIVDPTGKGEALFSLGPQKIALVLNNDLAIVRMMDMDIRDIRLNVTEHKKEGKDETINVAIGGLSGRVNYKEEKPGMWSGPSQFNIKNLSADIKGASDATSPGKFSFDEIAVSSTVKDWDIAMAKAFQDKMAELEEAGLNTQENMSGPAMSAFWSILMQYGLQQVDSFTTDVTVTNLRAVAKTGDFAVKSMGYGFDMSGMRGEKTAGAFRFKMADASSAQSSLPPETAKYIPSQVNFDLRFTNLPFKQIATEFGKLAEQGAAMDSGSAGPGGGNAQMIAMQAMMTMPALLGQAGTTLAVKDTYFTAPDYKFALDGDFTANPQAIYVMVGKLKALFTGLDELVTSLQAQSQQPGVAETERAGIAQMLQGLAMMQMMGQQGTDPSGKPTRIYDFELGADGAIKLNGTDFKNMMGGMGGGSGAPPSVPH